MSLSNGLMSFSNELEKNLNIGQEVKAIHFVLGSTASDG